MTTIFLKQTLRALAFSAPLLILQSTAPTLLSPVLGEVSLGTVQAQEAKPKKKEERKVRRTQAMSQKVYKQLAGAQEALEAKDYRGAEKILDALSKNTRKPLNDAEMANVQNLYAFLYYTQDNYPKALAAYRKIIELPLAPEGTVIAARFSLAQLYMATEQWRKGVDALNEWFAATPTPGASAYVLLGQAYYQLKDYTGALTNVNKAVSIYEEKGKTPKENWYALQQFLYYDSNDYKRAVATLEKLLTHYPKKQYWIQLSNLYFELKDEKKQLAAMETAYKQGMLVREREQVNMAYLYLANDVPYQAAKVLDKGVRNKSIEPTSKNLELLANSWRASQEVKKAIPEMAKAAKLSDKGELWTRLGSIYLDNDQHQKAVNALNAGLKKGKVKRPDNAQLLLGMAYFNLKKYDSARKAFKKAKKDERSEKYAKQWIVFMDKELERQRSLEDA